MNVTVCTSPATSVCSYLQASHEARRVRVSCAQIYRLGLSMACRSLTCMLFATLASLALHASASEANMTKVNMSNTQQLMHGLTIGESSTGLNRSSATANDGMKTPGAALRGGKNEASRAGNSSLADSRSTKSGIFDIDCPYECDLRGYDLNWCTRGACHCSHGDFNRRDYGCEWGPYQCQLECLLGSWYHHICGGPECVCTMNDWVRVSGHCVIR